jgi:hypothetical protein
VLEHRRSIYDAVVAIGWYGCCLVCTLSALLANNDGLMSHGLPGRMPPVVRAQGSAMSAPLNVRRARNHSKGQRAHIVPRLLGGKTGSTEQGNNCVAHNFRSHPGLPD